MPLPSREVVTLRLIFECEEEDIENEVSEEDQEPSPLLRLPVELRLKVLRYLLRIDRNRKAHTRRPAPSTISELLFLNPRRILEAAPFKHKGGQEIDGSPPVINTCPLHPAILMTCKKLYWEGKTVLYKENKVVGLQSGIRGVGAKLKNYGIPVWGPLPSIRLINAPGDDPQSALSRFDPVMLFTGQNTKPHTPLYICSYKDSADFMHALWIMIKCAFARGMRYNLSLSAEPRYRHVNRTDSFVKFAVLPWLHNHINSISFHVPSPALLAVDKVQVHDSKTADSRLQSIRDELSKHVAASNAEPNLHTYRAVCSYLEQVLLQAEICVEQMNFLSAELLFERVCYEASSIVRTRTSKLVDVSAKSKDGINRVCKLIAVSAFRLCELRSGSLAQLYSKGSRHPSPETRICREVTAREPGKINHALDAEIRDVSEDCSSATSSPARTNIAEESRENPDESSLVDASHANAAISVAPVRSKVQSLPRTTRLDQQLARDLAITSGLLALRLPCAAPVPEWNIRLDIMLLRLFAEREDMPNAIWSIRRIQSNCHVELKETKAKNKTGEKSHMLTTLMADLAKQLRPGAPRACLFETANKCQQVVTALWGERLVPKKGFNGLIWTFRWAG